MIPLGQCWLQGSVFILFFLPCSPSFLSSSSLPLSLTLLPVGTFVLCFIIWPLSPPSPASLSLSILFGSVHFSLECLFSQTSLCSSLPLLNTNKIHTTQVEQGARAQCDKRLTHHSITSAVNCPLFTLCRLLGTAPWLGPCKMGCPAWDQEVQWELDTATIVAETFPALSFGIVGLSVFYSLPMGPCSPRGSRDLLENGVVPVRGVNDLPGLHTTYLSHVLCHIRVSRFVSSVQVLGEF